MSTAIIDYGMGNLKSVKKACDFLGFSSLVTQNASEVERADKLVFPGVGAFGDCISNLKKLDLFDAIVNFIQSGKPFLGICLGLQTLFDFSLEGGSHVGLGVIPGSVVRFEHQLKVPHMGWNQIHFEPDKAASCPLLRGIKDGVFMYFVHSFFVIPRHAEVVVTKTQYGVDYTSMIWKDNVYAVQFHPEKSQKNGLQLLKNFMEL